MAKVGSFSHCTNKRTKFLLDMVQKVTDKITRERLREMQDGEQITVQCADGYDLDSQKNTAYAMQKMENCRFACKADGLTLTVTRYDTD